MLSTASANNSNISSKTGNSSFKISYLPDGTRLQESLHSGDMVYMRPDGSRLKVTKADGSRFETFPDGTSKWSPGISPAQENTAPNYDASSFKDQISAIQPVGDDNQPLIDGTSGESDGLAPVASTTGAAVEELQGSADDNSQSLKQQQLQQQARKQQEQLTSKEMMEHYHVRTMELERLILYTQKMHAKQIRVKDLEISEQRNKAQRAREAEDSARVELQRIMVKGIAHHNAVVNTLKSANECLKASSTPKLPTNVSMMSGLFNGNSSVKMQARLDINQLQKEHVKAITKMSDEMEKIAESAEKYKLEAQMYMEEGAKATFELKETRDDLNYVKEKNEAAKRKYRKAKDEKALLEQEREDLIIKAGWAAEQLQNLQADLEFERSKHVKQSRLTVVKQAEDLAKSRKENLALKKQILEVQQQLSSSSLSSSKKADASYKDAPLHVAPGVTEPYVAPMIGFSQMLNGTSNGSGALGQNTIAELVALKANQRLERAVKLDELIKKNKESKNSRKSLEGGNVLAKIVRKTVESRRGLMGEAGSDNDLSSMSGEDVSDDGMDWS